MEVNQLVKDFVSTLKQASEHQGIEYDFDESKAFFMSTYKEEIPKIMEVMRTDMEAANLFGQDLQKMIKQGKQLPALVSAAGQISYKAAVCEYVNRFLATQKKEEVTA
jgi:uncharacterized protein YaaR (DUF327 family)